MKQCARRKGVVSPVKNVQVGKSHTIKGEKRILSPVENAGRGKVILPPVKMFGK